MASSSSTAHTNTDTHDDPTSNEASRSDPSLEIDVCREPFLGSNRPIY